MITLNELRTMVNDRAKGGGTRIGQFESLRTKQKEDQRLYDLKYEIKMHKAYKPMKLPTARQLVDTFVSHLPLSKPVIEVVPFKDVNPYKNRAIAQQDYYTWLLIWYMNQLQNIVQKAAKDLGIRGEAYIKNVWDENAIGTTAKGDDREIAMLERMPLRMMCPDPLNCYPHADHIDCHPEDIIETYTLGAEQVRRVWPNWRSGASNTARVKLVEYWSTAQVCYLADGEPLLKDGIIDNPYGMIPYTHVYSGYGHPDVDNTPESKAVSLIRFAKQVIEQQCRYYAYLDKAVAFSSTPMLILPGSKTDYEEPPEIPYPGQIVYLGDIQGGEHARIDWASANLPAGILQAIGMTEGLLGKVQPGVVRGEAPKGIEAGYPMALLIGEARLQFGLPLQNLQTLFSRALEQVRVLIRDVAKETVPVWGEDKVIKLSPDDCEGAYRVSVEFDATTPEARAARALAGQRLRQGGSISLYTELKDYHNTKNPNKEIWRIKAESITKHPVLEGFVAGLAVRELEGEQAKLAIQQAMAEGEAGGMRKKKSAGKVEPTEAQLPEDILAQAIASRRGRAYRGETEAEQ